MIKIYNHPYYLCSIFKNFSFDFYNKFLINKIGGKIVGNDKLKYHFEKYKSNQGFFIGKNPHCVDVFIDNNEAIINNFSYFTNCSILGNFTRKNGTKHLMDVTLYLIKNYYKNIKIVKLSDTSFITCNNNKFQLFQYMILFYGITYYMKFGFIPENHNKLININQKINNTFISIDDISYFIEYNNQLNIKNIINKNKHFFTICNNILHNKSFKLRNFLDKIKFLKDLSKNYYTYFFNFVNYIYNKFFPEFNFYFDNYFIHL